LRPDATGGLRSVTIEALALDLWRRREVQFPPFCRRMVPDGVDRASGAWAMMLKRAEELTFPTSNNSALEPVQGR
jgi:hypothetical protein